MLAIFRTLLLATLVSFVGLISFASNRLASVYQKWLDEDVHFIITNSERTQFNTLQSDIQRDRFIEEFWSRRNPTPGTPENEFKEEHYRRLAFANQHFAAGVPGWRTDRGRVYVLYGPPDEIEKRVAETATRPIERYIVAAPIVPYEIWRYHHITGAHRDVTVKFVDTCKCGDFVREKDPATDQDLP